MERAVAGGDRPIRWHGVSRAWAPDDRRPRGGGPATRDRFPHLDLAPTEPRRALGRDSAVRRHEPRRLGPARSSSPPLPDPGGARALALAASFHHPSSDVRPGLALCEQVPRFRRSRLAEACPAPARRPRHSDRSLHRHCAGFGGALLRDVHARPSYNACDGSHELRRLDRLRDMNEIAGMKRARPIFGAGQRGERDCGQPATPGRAEGPYPSEEFVAIDVRHADVAHQDVRSLRLDERRAPRWRAAPSRRLHRILPARASSARVHPSRRRPREL